MPLPLYLDGDGDNNQTEFFTSKYNVVELFEHHTKLVYMDKVPTIVPLIFAFLAPVLFSVSGVLAKHLS